MNNGNGYVSVSKFSKVSSSSLDKGHISDHHVYCLLDRSILQLVYDHQILYMKWRRFQVNKHTERFIILARSNKTTQSHRLKEDA